MGTMGRTWNLYRKSFDVLCADVEIVLFPVMSAISAILLAAGVFFRLHRTGMLESLAHRTADWNVYTVFFLWYFLNYLIVVFFNSALVGCAQIRLSGGDPKVRDGLRIAFRHLDKIIFWSLLAATVGVLLDSLRTKGNRLLGSLVASGLGLSWTLITYLIIPVIILEDRTTYDSMERSAELFRKKWGEEIAGSFGFGLLNLLLIVPAALLAWWVFRYDQALAIIFFIWYVIILTAISSAVKGIFTVVLYRYACDAELPASFSPKWIDDTFRSQARQSQF